MKTGSRYEPDSLIWFMSGIAGFLVNRRINLIERRHESRIQFNVDANFIGVQKKYCITEILIILENQGFTKFTLDAIRLKVQGIHVEEEIILFQKNYETKHIDSIVEFPQDLINTNMLARMKKDQKGEPEKIAHFLEPGVVQRFTYIAAIPKDTRFILVTASFKYHEKSEHTAKRVFEVKTGNSHKRESRQ